MNFFRLLSLFLLLSPMVSDAKLFCSSNGTHVVYLNGVNNSFDDNQKSAHLVDDEIQRYKGLLDENSNVGEAEGLYNYSTDLETDIRKFREQLILDADGVVTNEKRRKHFEELIKKEFGLASTMNWNTFFTKEKNDLKIKKTLDYIYNVGARDSLTYGDGNFTSLQIYRDLVDLNFEIAKLFAIAASDRQVTTQIKSRIKNLILEQNKKVIFVSHSQGNEALKTAYLELRNEYANKPDDLDRISKVLGVLHVASPSPVLVVPEGAKGRRITLNVDLVIFGSRTFISDNTSVTPNYYYVEKLDIPFLYINAYDLARLLFSTTNFHSFIDTYLSSTVKVRPISNPNAIPLKMTEIFKTNITGIAQELESNCNLPSIQITSANATANPAVSNTNMYIDGYAGQGRTIRIKVADIGGDKNGDGKDDNGYDRKKTTFTYKVTTTYDSKIKNVVEDQFTGTNEIVLSVPYSDFVNTVEVTANNQYNLESTVKKVFIVSNRKLPTGEIASSSCYVDQWGYNDSGLMFYTLKITDDTFANLNKTLEGAINDRNGVHKYAGIEIPIVNTCPVVPTPIRWEVVATCQLNSKPCPGTPAGTCNTFYYTGTQFNSVYFYWPSGDGNDSAPLGVDGSYGHSVEAPFRDPNNAGAYITYPTGEACPRGQEVESGNTIPVVIMSN